MKLRLVVFGILVMLVISACAPPVALRDPNFLKDTSLVSGEPCSAPCWRGITPSETNWNSALTIFEDSADVSNLQSQQDEETGARSIEFDARDGTRCCRIFSEDGETVSSMFILFAPDMTVGQAIEKYGEPAYFFAEEITEDQALVSLVYPDVPLIIYAFSAGITIGEISETSEIVGALFLTLDEMQNAIQGSNLYFWRDYGVLETLTQGGFDITPEPEAGTNAEATANVEVTPEATAQSGN
jgi:hypothetical protein